MGIHWLYLNTEIYSPTSLTMTALINAWKKSQSVASIAEKNIWWKAKFSSISRKPRIVEQRKHINMLDLLYTFYPYSYMTKREKFAEKELSPLQNWSDVFNGGKVAFSQADLEHARKEFRVFKCQNLEDYHNLYLKCDTLLLACVFEEFWQISHQTYGVDCAHHFSASNLAREAFKRISTDSNVQLLSDHRHLEMVENMMRGGTASVFHSRFFKTNNKECPDFNPDQPSTYGFMIDANNHYGGACKRRNYRCVTLR